jgi:multidrug resistance efflux pump
MHSTEENDPSVSELSGREERVDSPTHQTAGATQTGQLDSSALRDGSRRHRGHSSFPSHSASPLPANTRPTPLPKRPKGRLFVGFLLLALCILIGYLIWDWQFRYEAHGVVQGRVLRVSPPWDGNVTALHVREGDTVRQGQLLLTFENIRHHQQLAKVADELKLAQAKLEAQVSQLRWQSQLRGDRNQKALGEYYEMWGELLDQRSRLMQAEADLKRLQTTQRKNNLAVRQKDLDNAEFRVSGQRAKTEKLSNAVEELKKRVEIYEQFQDDASAQIRPEILNIENLQAELKRLRQLVQQGHVCSPVNGTVVKVNCYGGDFSTASQTVMEIVEEHSLEPVLYVPQNRAAQWQVGDKVEIQVASGQRQVVCRVTRLGDQMEPAPPNIERYYRKSETLLPVFLKPERHGDDLSRLCLGSEVKLGQRWFHTSPNDKPEETEKRLSPGNESREQTSGVDRNGATDSGI